MIFAIKIKILCRENLYHNLGVKRFELTLLRGGLDKIPEESLGVCCKDLCSHLAGNPGQARHRVTLRPCTPRPWHEVFKIAFFFVKILLLSQKR
jgi:hypothetical protein